MKDYTITSGATPISFKVDEDWLDGVKIKATGDPAEQIYNAAMSDPEKSGITTDDDAMNKSIEDVKALVAKAKDINREKNADIRVIVENPGAYTVRFAGQVYEAKLSIKEADRAIDKIRAYLDHDNLIKVRIFKASGKSDLQRAMDLEAFVNNRAHKVISISDDGEKYTLMYIAKRYAADEDDD